MSCGVLARRQRRRGAHSTATGMRSPPRSRRSACQPGRAEQQAHEERPLTQPGRRLGVGDLDVLDPVEDACLPHGRGGRSSQHAYFTARSSRRPPTPAPACGARRTSRPPTARPRPAHVERLDRDQVPEVLLQRPLDEMLGRGDELGPPGSKTSESRPLPKSGRITRSPGAVKSTCSIRSRRWSSAPCRGAAAAVDVVGEVDLGHVASTRGWAETGSIGVPGATHVEAPAMVASGTAREHAHRAREPLAGDARRVRRR